MRASGQEIVNRWGRLHGEKNTTDNLCRNIQRLIYPSGEEFVSRSYPGRDQHYEVFDSSGELANDLLAAGLHSLLSNPATNWFDYKAEKASLNRIYSVKRWLDAARDHVMNVFRAPGSFFGTQAHESYLDLGAYGTSCMIVLDRPGRRLPLFSAQPFSEIVMAEDDEGKTDTVYRKFQYTARQAAARWPRTIDADTLARANDPTKMDDNLWFIHAVEPRPERDVRRQDALHLPVRSVFVREDVAAAVFEGGYHEMAYVGPKWQKRTYERYGRGPGHKALHDVRTLQRAMRVNMVGAERAMAPPNQVADQGVSYPVDLRADALNYVRADLLARGGDGIKPILGGTRPDIGEEFMQGVRDRVDAAFMKPLMTILRDPRATATMSLQAEEESLRLMAPMLGRQETQWSAPLVDRVLGIELRAGRLPEMPPELEGEVIEAEFISPSARAAKIAEARSVAQTGEIMAPYATLDPEILDNQDMDETYRHVAEVVGQPARLLRDPEQVKAMRAARNEARQNQQRVEEITSLADAAGKAAPALELAQQQAA